MKEYYSIGETAKLLGVTTTTLRHYEKIGILKPKKISEDTGYRWYTYDQFHMVNCKLNLNNHNQETHSLA